MPLGSRIADVFRGDRLTREIDDEPREQHRRGGRAGSVPDEARRAFESLLQHRERSRDVRLIVWLDSLLADAIFGWRQFRKKVTSAAAILSLAPVIGACTAAFRLIDALLLRPMPLADASRLYVLSRQGLDWNGPPNLRWVGVSGISADARRSEGSSGVDRALLYGPCGFGLRRRPVMEKAHLQYVSGRCGFPVEMLRSE